MPEPVPHPTAQQLTAFALGKLPEAALAAIARHLDGCPVCQRAVTGLPADSFMGKVQAAKPGAASLPPRAAMTRVAGAPLRSADEPSLAAAPENVPAELANHAKYRIVRELGRGGMGVVYQAVQTLMDRPVALKVINPSVLEHAEALPRFQAEVKAAARLDHANIVRAYDADQVGRLHLLVMEFVEGKNLFEVVSRKGPLPIANACHYLRQAALGLQHAFEQGMTHRDIKPQNLMLTPRGVVKILDFGLARLRDEGAPKAGRLTTLGAFMGTPEYVAPEQATDARSADVRADIYSLGCTLYFLLTGRPPFQEETVVNLILAQIEKEPPPLHTLRGDVPEELAAVVGKMLAKDPAQRYQKPVEVAQALLPFVKAATKGSGGKVTAPPPVVRSPGMETRMGGDTSQLPGPRPQAGTQLPAGEASRQEETAAPFEDLTGVAVVPKKGTKAGPAAQRVRRDWYKGKPVLAGVAAALVALGLGAWLLAGVVFKTKVKTAEGEAFLVLEVDQPGAEVVVDGQKITVNIPGDNQPVAIKVDPGEHRLRISKDGFEAVTRDIELKTGKSNALKVRLEPVRVATVQAGEPQSEVKAAASPQPERRPGDIRTNSIGMKFAWIPPGTFLMGSPADEEERVDDEAQHRVTLTKGFYLGINPVTQAQWQDVMGSNPSHFQGDDWPVEMVTWDDCQEFCKKLGARDGKPYRLPTEAEWEYACRAGTTTPFYFGQTISPDQANYDGTFTYGQGRKGLFRQQTTPVGSFPPNTWGLYDMHGNVLEWCQDWYGPYGKEDNKNPEYSNSGESRVLRGGSWYHEPGLCRSAYRFGFTPAIRVYDAGCRVVLCLD